MTTPSDQVRGPQDLVAYMNTARADDWDKIPFPAKQQLGYHDRLRDARSGNGVNDYTGLGPEELVGALELSEPTASTRKLSSFVDYHLEITPPPAQPAGAPGSSGYNERNRNVPAAKGFENPAEATVTGVPGARAVQYAPGQGLSEDAQARVDGVGPYVPSPVAIRPGSGNETTPDAERRVYGTATGVQHGHAESFTTSPTPTPGGVPDGSIDKVLAWVGTDRSRAQQALDAEQQKDEPRRSLIERLNSKLED